jgi:hypothetical protein
MIDFWCLTPLSDPYTILYILQEEFEDTKGAIRILHMPIYPYYSQCKARFNINDWITAIFELCVGKVEIEGKNQIY